MSLVLYVPVTSIGKRGFVLATTVLPRFLLKGLLKGIPGTPLPHSDVVFKHSYPTAHQPSRPFVRVWIGIGLGSPVGLVAVDSRNLKYRT